MRVVHGTAVLWRLRAIVHAVIADHAGDAQPVIVENRRAPLALRLAVLRHIAPGRDGVFIPEDRQRQDLAGFGQALEPLDRNKAIDGFQDRLQFGREVEIFLPVLRLRPDLENHRDHVRLLVSATPYSVT